MFYAPWTPTGSERKGSKLPIVKVDPFAPQLLIDYDLYCRSHGYVHFGTFMAHWYAITALIEAWEEEELSLEEMSERADALFPALLPN